MKKLLYLMTILGLICCKSSNKQDYEYIPLNNITNDTSLINLGEEVKLLAFSGGKDNDKNNIYYQQIIVTTENFADTLIIVCPLLKMPYPDENTGRFYITPLEYNPEKKILNATYERKSDSLNLLLQVLGDLSESENKSFEIGIYMDNKVIKNELVAVNKSISIFQNKYKTIIGILKFDVDPR